MTETKPSRWKVYLRRGLAFLMALVLLAWTSYAYGAWMRSVRTSYLLQCRQARDAENWVELQAIAERWTTWDRRNADAWLFRADAAQHCGNFASAAECLKSIPDSDPNYLPALVSLSTLQFNSLNRPLDGVKTCEQLLMKEPRTTAAHQQLIEFYAISLQRRQLEYQIRFAIQSSREPPTSYIYLFLIDTMRLEGAVESNNRWLEQYPDSEVFLVARVLQMPEPDGRVNSESDEDKYALVDSLFQRFPNNLELLAYKVDSSIGRGNTEALMELLLHLPVEADEDPRFWRAKGWLHLTRGEISKAKQALQQAIKLYPLDWKARNWLADALRNEGNLAEADSLHEIVQLSRNLRQRIVSTAKDQHTSNENLEALARLAEKSGDLQVAEALKRRLRLK